MDPTTRCASMAEEITPPGSTRSRHNQIGNALPLEMLNHSRSWNLGRKVNDGPDHPLRFDGRGNHAAGIDPIQTQSFPIAAVTLEIPPRNSILGADDGGLWPQHRP